MSYGIGQIDYSGSAPGERLGIDSSRILYTPDNRVWNSSARWAQRGINAWRSANPGHGPQIYVDGRAGPVTIAALNAASPGAAAENYPIGTRVTDRILLNRAFADRLSALAPVRDPARPAASTTTRATSTSTSSSGDAAKAGGGTAVTPASSDAVVVDEGTSGGLPAWLVPALVVGGVVLVGSAVIVGMSRRKVRANRPRKTNKAKRKGRRVRRNGEDVGYTIVQQLGGHGRLSAMIGAKNWVNLGNGVQFSFAGKRATGNKIVIKLNGRDTYDVEFWWIRGADMKLVHEDNDVCADSLRSVIESQTGMRLSLNRRRLAA